jgi:tetratricopeptide (TPR) repeat protein
MNDLEWKNDSVFISSEMPYRATQNSFQFVFDREVEGFFATDVETYDPSWEAVEKADSMLAAGNLRGAINSYYNVFYPHAYINEGEVGMKLMELAHKKALAFFKENNADSAVGYMNIALDYYPNSNYISFKTKEEYDELMSDEAGWQRAWTEDQIKLWLGDHGLFLYKAKKYSESIELNAMLNMILPELAGPYLQLGDSYYDSGKKTEAKKAYLKYSELKKAQKKEKDIPKRVKERSR